MSHYMVFLNTGETVHVWATDSIWDVNKKLLCFTINLKNMAIFNTDNICGFVDCRKDDDE